MSNHNQGRLSAQEGVSVLATSPCGRNLPTPQVMSSGRAETYEQVAGAVLLHPMVPSLLCHFLRDFSCHEGFLLDFIPNPQFTERFLLRSTALVWVTAWRHSWISWVQSAVLNLHQVSREVRGTARGLAIPVKGQSCLNWFSTFPLLHFKDFYGKHICNVFDCMYGAEN